MTSPILLTGGTGTLGGHLLPLLLEAGPVRVLSRERHEPTEGVEFVVGDLATGDGTAAAVVGVHTVVHCAGSAKGDDVKTANLARAAAAAGVRHLVYISVVGADRVPVVGRLDRAMFGYFAAKRASERVVETSGLAWTTLRATQFHDAMLAVVRQMVRLPVVPVPTARFQPVDTGEVAARLAELALGPARGLVADLAGPRVHPMRDLVRSYLAATGRHRLMVPVRPPGRAAAAVRDGANLSLAPAAGHRSWEEFLAEHVAAPNRSSGPPPRDAQGLTRGGGPRRP
jgi:uncharacterized protein YbjT (DUF2867 family)